MRMTSRFLKCDCGALNSPHQRRCGRCGDTLGAPTIRTPAPPRAGDTRQETAASHFDRMRATVELATQTGKP
jgi:hypothetical protein